MKSSLDIVIVNRNSGQGLFECLSSISTTDKNDLVLRRVLVVDDGSTDGSARDINQMPLPLQIIRNEVHTGYGASCNRAAAQSTAEYILFLNTDTVLQRNSLTVPLHYMEQPEHARVGIVGIQLMDNEGVVSRSCSRFPTFGRMLRTSLGLDRISPSIFPSHQMTEWNHLDTREVDQVIGAFMLVRRSVFERLGGYDERFFVYMEDLDFTVRMRRIGYTSVYLSSAEAFHEGGATFRRVKAESLFFRFRSGIQYAFKHFGTLRGFAVLIFTVALEPIPRLTFAVWRNSWGDVKATARAYVLLWKELMSLSLLRRERRGDSAHGGAFKQGPRSVANTADEVTASAAIQAGESKS